MGFVISVLTKLVELLMNLDVVVRLWKVVRKRMKRKPKRKPKPRRKKTPDKDAVPAPQEPSPGHPVHRLEERPKEPEPPKEQEPETPPVLEKPKWGRPRNKQEAIDMYRVVMEKHADGIPLVLLLAVGWQESTFNPTAYRYEPNYDYTYVRKVKSVRLDLPPYKDFLCEGITIDEWFAENPKRSARERREGRDYSFPAQLRIAASYGIMQLMYPTAVGRGHRAAPELLHDPEVNVPLGIAVLRRHLKRYGGDEQDAVAAYNAGKARRKADGAYRNQAHVDRVMFHRAEFEKLLTSPAPPDTV